MKGLLPGGLRDQKLIGEFFIHLTNHLRVPGWRMSKESVVLSVELADTFIAHREGCRCRTLVTTTAFLVTNRLSCTESTCMGSSHNE